jgi:hypothetical protein
VETIGTDSSELVTNGGFDTDSDWTNSTSSGSGATNWTIASGVATSSSSAGYMIQAKGTVGTMITITYEITSYTSGDLFCVFGSGSPGLLIKTNTSIGTHSITGMVTDNSDVGFYSLGILSIDNISIRATTELITNGDFETVTDGSVGYDNEDGTVDGWTSIAGAQLSISNNNLKVEHGGTNNARASISIQTIVGKQYVLSAEVIEANNSSNAGRIYFNDATSNSYTVDVSNGNIGTVNFTARHQETLIILNSLSNGVGTYVIFDNVSVRPAEADRSVNDNGLRIIGEINKTPVAPGADLVAYSGFSDNNANKLIQPYNSGLDFGTGDFYFNIWFNATNTSNQGVLFVRMATEDGDADWSNSGNIIQVEFNGTYLRSLVGGTGYSPLGKIDIDDGVFPSGVWNMFTFLRRSGTLEAYHNGTFVDSTKDENSDRDVTNTSGKLWIGNKPSTGYRPFDGSLALLRASATAPTPEQIAKIYRDEKALFQDGAQATLYGTSDAVTALAYDDSNQLLHVGTDSGRSDFRGLARVNNTTTAISNSISAAEGTIIQN